MGLDIDYVFAKRAIQELEKTLLDTPHGERKEITDEITDFVEKIKEKYNYKKDEYKD